MTFAFDASGTEVWFHPAPCAIFRGALAGRSDKDLFITTGTFTADARKEATRHGATPIDLVDGDRFYDLLKKWELGIQTEMVEQVLIDREWFGKV